MELEQVPAEESSSGLNVELKADLKSEENSVDPDNEGVIKINSIHELNKVSFSLLSSIFGFITVVYCKFYILMHV